MALPRERAEGGGSLRWLRRAERQISHLFFKVLLLVSVECRADRYVDRIDGMNCSE